MSQKSKKEEPEVQTTIIEDIKALNDQYLKKNPNNIIIYQSNNGNSINIDLTKLVTGSSLILTRLITFIKCIENEPGLSKIALRTVNRLTDRSCEMILEFNNEQESIDFNKKFPLCYANVKVEKSKKNGKFILRYKYIKISFLTRSLSDIIIRIN